MYSILAGRSCVQASELGVLLQLSADMFLPTSEDFAAMWSNLVVLINRIITRYINGLLVLSKSVPQHIQHKYFAEMGRKSEVIVLDVLMKNEASRSDMIDIMKCMHDYLGKEYDTKMRVPSGGDQLTCERQVGAQRHTMDVGTIHDRCNWGLALFPLSKSECNHTNYYTSTCTYLYTCYNIIMYTCTNVHTCT